jgi:hypothetical protein
MNSLPSETTRDIASSKVTYVNETVTCQIEGKDEMQSQTKQQEDATCLDMQSKLNSGKKRTTFALTIPEAPQTTMEFMINAAKDTSDRLRGNAVGDKFPAAPPIRRYKKQRMTGSQMFNIKSQVITKHHRRNNAFVSLEDVLLKIYERKGSVLRKSSPASIQE